MSEITERENTSQYSTELHQCLPVVIITISGHFMLLLER